MMSCRLRVTGYILAHSLLWVSPNPMLSHGTSPFSFISIHNANANATPYRILNTTKYAMLSSTIHPAIFAFTTGYLLSTTLLSPKQSLKTIHWLHHLQELTLHSSVTRTIRPTTLCSSLSPPRTCPMLINSSKTENENVP